MDTLKPANRMAERLIETLELHEMEPRSYSGRGMYGAYCVGVTLENERGLFALGQVLPGGIPAPTLDDMGKGIIAYWPDAKLDTTT